LKINNKQKLNDMEKQQIKAVFTDVNTGKELIISMDYNTETNVYDVNISSNPKESVIKMMENNESSCYFGW